MMILVFEQYSMQTVPINGISIVNQRIKISSKVGIVDTGTSLLAAPYEEGLELMQKLSDYSECVLIKGSFTCKCSQISLFPNITFQIQGYSFPIQPRDYFMPNDRGECIFLITLLQGFEGYQPF